MAYSEQTASSPDDVINKIAVFAAANGWTVDRNNLSSSNRTMTLHYGATTDYVHLYNVDGSNIWILGSVGYDSGLTPVAHPNRSNPAVANAGVGPYTKLYMFANASPAPHIHCVIELTGGIFRHLSFGMIDKLGTWTGGTFVDATYWSTGQDFVFEFSTRHSPIFDSHAGAVDNFFGSLRCDIPLDGRTNAWAQMWADSSYRAYTRLAGGGPMVVQFYNRNDPPFSGQVTLGTFLVEVFRIGGMWSPAGTIPNVRYLNMLRFNPGQEITVGSDVWKVFPMARKGHGEFVNGVGAPNTYSDNHAYAFLKTA